MSVSLKPSDAIEGGGLLDDADVKVVSSRFTIFDYQGKGEPAPGILWEIEVPGTEKNLQQFWSVGKADDWMPSEDGKSLDAVGKATQLVNSSNGVMLLSSLVEAGFPENKIGEDITIFEGMECHMLRTAVERKGLKSDKETTVLLVSKIITIPGEAPAAVKDKGKGSSGGKGKGKGAAKGGGKTAQADDNTVVEEATELLMNALSENPGGLEKKQITKYAFDNIAKDNPNRNAIIQLVFKDTFLKDGPWEYADGRVIMG